MKHRALAALAAGTLAAGAMLGTAAAGSAAQGAVNYTVVEKYFTVYAATPRTFTVNCPRGMVPVGGGGHAGQGSVIGNPQVGIFGSDISLTHRGWTVAAYLAAGYGPESFTADAVCMTA